MAIQRRSVFETSMGLPDIKVKMSLIGAGENEGPLLELAATFLLSASAAPGERPFRACSHSRDSPVGRQTDFRFPSIGARTSRPFRNRRRGLRGRYRKAGP